MSVRLKAKVRERRFGLRPRLYVGSVCDAQRGYSCSMRFMTLYTCSWKTACQLSYKCIENVVSANTQNIEIFTHET